MRACVRHNFITVFLAAVHVELRAPRADVEAVRGAAAVTTCATSRFDGSSRSVHRVHVAKGRESLRCPRIQGWPYNERMSFAPPRATHLLACTTLRPLLHSVSALLCRGFADSLLTRKKSLTDAHFPSSGCFMQLIPSVGWSIAGGLSLRL